MKLRESMNHVEKEKRKKKSSSANVNGNMLISGERTGIAGTSPVSLEISGFRISGGFGECIEIADN
jgi:hypothetical protein